MNRINITAALLLLIGAFYQASGQQMHMYAFARTPQLANYNFSNESATYSEGVSAGVGIYRKSLFLEVATFIFDGDTYGYYTFFGTTVKSNEIAPSIYLNTNVFGEVTTLPSQSDIDDPLWIYTSGVCFMPNVQVQKLNVGIALCSGLAYQEESFSLNNRFILNLAFTIGK